MLEETGLPYEPHLVRLDAGPGLTPMRITSGLAPLTQPSTSRQKKLPPSGQKELPPSGQKELPPSGQKELPPSGQKELPAAAAIRRSPAIGSSRA